MTKRGTKKYQTLRYWDGARWFSVEISDKRGGIPTQWPVGATVPRMKWMCGRTFYARAIHAGQEKILWGIPQKVYEPKEVLKYLVHRGDMPANWKTAFQDEMRRDNW
ncbi:hypothetical protein [Castellaniella sp.]|uniref:hypothetical protein n=1 Tax=Castellaniella sp. TaxID=1955812 RepID=UPI002AFFFD7E|nr:hypothetical protein [Castellaniella sp.]